MKKIKMFAAAAMFCAAAFAGYTAYDQATMTTTERMIQANIEALTYSVEVDGVKYEDCVAPWENTCFIALGVDFPGVIYR